jgi:Domain of unknown function (DUF4383)
MAKTICKLLGLALLLVGLLGFTHLLDSLGFHLTTYHNAVHVVSGLIALYFGFAGSAGGARGFCLLFGLVYLALGVCGFLFGDSAHIWHVIDDLLMFGRRDDALHVVLGVVFLAGGLLGKSE